MRDSFTDNTKKRQRRDYNGDARADDEQVRLKQELNAVKSKASRPPSLSGDYRVHKTAREALAQRGILLKQTIGIGTYSKVKLAQCQKRGTVAVKIINRNKGNEDYYTKFLPREIAVWSKLKHPNIIRMYDSFKDGRQVYIVLEYATHGDVLVYIQCHGAMEEPQAKTWAYQLVDAVTYLHRRNIAHRDLKLENIVIDDGFNVKLCDFGFAKENCFDDLTTTYCGSINYAPPEILRGEPYEANKADVWSIGVIVFILTTGSVPFDGDLRTRAIQEAQIHPVFTWNDMKPISAECRGFIYYAFRFNFRSRPTIHRIRQHPWFRSYHPVAVPAPTKSEGNILLTEPGRALKRRRRRPETRSGHRETRHSSPELTPVRKSLYQLHDRGSSSNVPRVDALNWDRNNYYVCKYGRRGGDC